MTDPNPIEKTLTGRLLGDLIQRRESYRVTGEALAEETAEIVRMYRRHGWTLAEIGSVMKLTHQRVAQLTTERRTDDHRRDPSG